MRFRPSILALALLFPSLATAGPTGGGGGSGPGGRLGQVSGGLRGGGARPPRVGGSGGGTSAIIYAPVVVVDGTQTIVYRRKPAPPDGAGGGAKMEAYAGAQGVHESQGAWHVELGVRDGLFRLRGAVTRYYEEQRDGRNLTLTIPALIGGIRIDGGGPTRVFLEGGFVGARTRNDMVADSSLTGGLGGIRLEHRMTRDATFIGEVHEMVFFQDDVRAHSARVGVKFNVLQASLRVLDFNVGPALYGPEIGLAF
jgi:hypothetical protein